MSLKPVVKTEDDGGRGEDTQHRRGKEDRRRRHRSVGYFVSKYFSLVVLNLR